jgi:hypothetical protein
VGDVGDPRYGERDTCMAQMVLNLP